MPEKNISQAVYLHYLSALLDGDKFTCIKIVQEQLDANIDVKKLYVDLLQKSMYRIGHLWENSRTSISTEHVATKITEGVIELVYPKILQTPRNGRKVIMTCVDKEFHELGARVISDYFELNGWTSVFLGANTPRTEVLNIISKKRPDVLGISNNLYMNVVRVYKLIELIRSDCSDLKIIVGGQAFDHDAIKSLEEYSNVFYIPSMDDLDKFFVKHFPAV